AQHVARSRSLDLFENARLFAMLGLAMADAGIVCWDAKYTHEFWRPISAIREADLDGNAATTADPSWSPLLISPAFPEYVSGHSTFSGAAASILAGAFGDATPFTSTSDGLPGVTRSFTSFTQAAEEAGMSRIYGGIHFAFSSHDGLKAGREVAAAVMKSFAAQDTEPPRITVTSPSSGAVVASSPTVTGSVNDFQSGVQSLSARLDGGPATPVGFDATTGRFTFPVNLPVDGSADGQHRLVLTATDHAGNVSAEYTLVVTLDTQVPVISLTSPIAGDDLANSIGLIGRADPTGPYLTRVQYSFNGGTPSPIAFDPQSGSFNEVPNTSRLGIGDHTLVVEATDAAGNVATTSVSIQISRLDSLSLTSVEPRDGSLDVGATFRPRLVFSRPVDPATLGGGAVTATAAGQALGLTVTPSDDGASAWVFFDRPLPDAAQVTLRVDGSKIRGAADGVPLDADSDGVPGGLLVSRFTSVSLSPLPGTSLSGVVVDPGPDLVPGTVDDVRSGPDGVLMTADDVYLRPIAGARVFILGRESEVVVTDAQGRFRFDAVPAGNVKLAIDGRTATSPPAGYFFPEMVMDLNVQVGRANTVMGTMGERAEAQAAAAIQGVYLPRVASSILKPVAAAGVTRLTGDVASAPGLTPTQRVHLSLEVAGGGLIGENGSKLVGGGQIGFSTVPPELVRDMLPPGVLQHSFDITIQAPGVAAFSTPAVLTVPNVFNAAPGTKLNLLSFDHTTGRLVIEGSMTVSADGLSVTTDPGQGIVRPGWHGASPGTPCEPCEEPGADSGGGSGPLGFSILADEEEIEPKDPFGAKGLENKLFGHDGEKVTITLTNKLPKVNEKKDDGLIVVEVKADGPYARFLTGSALKGLIGKKEFCAGEHKFEFEAKDLLNELRNLAPADQLDQLFGTTFKLTAYQKTKPKEILARKSFTLARFVGVTDPKTWEEPKSSNFTAAFLKTLADGSGGFTRTKQVQYDMPKDTAVTLELDGADSGAFTLGTTSLKGKAVTNWKFDPGAKNAGAVSDYDANIKLKVKDKDLGTINAVGQGVPRTNLGPGVSGIEAAFKEYLASPLIRNEIKPSTTFDALYSRFYSNFGIGQSQEIKNEIDAAAAEMGTLVFAAMATNFDFLRGAGAVTVVSGPGDFSVEFAQQLKDGQGRLRFGADPAADVDFSRMKQVLDNAQIPVAAKEYAFANALNNTLRGERYTISFGKHAQISGSTSFADFLADTISHEVAHSMGLLDSYDRASLKSIYEPKDMMIAGFNGRPNMQFDPSTNQMVLKAGTGVAPNKPGSLEAAMKTFRANGNFGLLGANLDEELAPRPGLAVQRNDGEPFDGRGLDFGTVLADGPGGARAVQSLLVTNVGSAPATITSVTFGAAGFSISGSALVGTTLASGDSVVVELDFDPVTGAEGAVGGSFAIAYGVEPDLSFTLPITATALASTGRLALTLQPDPSDGLTPQNNLGGGTVGGTPVFVSQFATLTNVGGGPLTISDVAVVKGVGQFVVSGLPAGFGPGQPVALAPGESLSFDLRFQPDAPGLRPGRLRIVTDDPSGPETFQAVVGTGLPATGTLYRPDGNHVAMASVARPNDPVFRSRTDARGHYRFVVPGGASYAISSFDRFSGLVAQGGGIASPAGVPTSVNPLLFVPSTAPDSDGDGLPDDAEFAIGTSPFKVDTNGDGVDDFASVIQGLDPLEGVAFPTGVVAGLDLGGAAGAFAVVATPGESGGRLAYVTTGDALAVVDLTRFDRPQLLSRLP
ncbi:MAG: choice-of-anchor D domain-containing protein, partial [Isosphaeraceae bacterium]